MQHAQFSQDFLIRVGLGLEPGPIVGGSDIKITVEEVNTNSTGVAGGFTLLLKDIN